MLDIHLLRDKLDWVKERLVLVGCDPAEVQAVADLDRRRRDLLVQVETLRSERKSASKDIGKMKPGAEQEHAKAAVRQVGEKLGGLEKELAEIEERFGAAMLELPNLPHEAVPPGKDDRENAVVRVEGKQRELDFEPKPHWEIGERLGIIDFERGVKISGTRFYVLRGEGARLQRALISFMLDLHTREHGYTEIYPPAMVRRECLIGTGNLPKFGDNLYRDVEDEFWFVPTAEVPVTNLYRDEILDGAALPIKHAAYSPCFRREKMSAGRDVRGMARASVRQGRARQVVEPSRGRRATIAARRCRGRLPPARDPASHRPDVHRRSQLRRGDEVRHRGVGPGLQRVARGFLVLELP
jgi:seryl-tRNA synthetase